MGHPQPQQTWDNSKVWRPDDNVTPVPRDLDPERLYKPEVLKTIEEAIFGLSEELRALSLDIHSKFRCSSNILSSVLTSCKQIGHPELAFKERYFLSQALETHLFI